MTESQKKGRNSVCWFCVESIQRESSFKTKNKGRPKKKTQTLKKCVDMQQQTNS